MSTAIAVYSKHHGNTRKLVNAIKNANPEIQGAVDFYSHLML